MRMKKSSITGVFLLILSLLLCGQGVAAERTRAKESQRFITIDFENVDINLFIKYISELTGKNFIIDKTVKGNITIVSPTKISEDEAYRVFESVLDVHGFTTVQAGAVIKIIPSVKARSENIRTFQSGVAEHPEDQIVTQLIPLKHTSPDEIKKVLAPLVSKTSVVIAHTQSGMLIVTETLSNIHRLLSIIEAIDVAYSGEEVLVLPLKHASTTTISKALSAIFKSGAVTVKKGAKKQSAIRIVPYDRINALIIVATPTDIERVQQLVKVLDVEMEKDGGNFHVFFLQNATAAEMVKILNFLPGQQDKKDSKGKAPAISKDVKIMADEQTNALIINATRSEYNVLEGVIKKLDIPRRMVYLECLIMEVQTSKNFEVGVEWAMGGKFSDDTGVAAAGFSSSGGYSLLGGLGEASPSETTGFSLGLLKQGIQIGGITFPNIGAVLKAYKNDSDINVVSTPQLLTTDNKKAEIVVGENIPYITSQNTTTAEQDYTNYEYKDVATKLAITPHINQANTLSLEITTEYNKVKSNTDNKPETFTRTVDTTVIVRDGETVVIGGIIGQDTTESVTKIPLLGDIPLIGWLFRHDTSSNRKTNMFVFITPRIIKNPADLVKVTLEKEGQLGEVMPQVKEEFHRDVNISHAIRLVELGYQKLAAGFRDDAKDYFLESLTIDPNNPYANFNLGTIYEEEGDKKKAFDSYQKVILTGTASRVIDTTDPDKVGDSLIQLATENITRMRKTETSQDERFREEEGQ